MGNAFDEVIKLQLKWKKKGNEVHKAFLEWREIWKAKGPVDFAEQILRLDPETGNELKLSDEQKVFLNDLAFNGVKFAIAIAGRGGGKTFVIACYVAWRIYTHEYWGIATIGGSKEQTAKIRKYMAYWITKHDEIAKYTLTCTKDTIETHCNSYATFNPCFTGDTVVYGDYNTKFSDLDVNNSICSEGEKINPNILFITQYSGELIKIKPMGLLPIKCTPEHPIYVTNFKKYKKWIHIDGHKHYGEGKWTIEKIGSEMKIAKELNTKDYLMIPRKQSFNTFNNEELAWLLGAYLAEGWIEKKFNPKVKKYYESVKFGLGKHETDFINKIYELSNKYFKTGSIDNKYCETATKISLYKKGAVNFFKTCGTSSKNKHIALFIKDANPKIVRAFIEGYLEGDGNTTHKDSLRISTTTEQIIYDLIEIFTMNLGILPNVYVEKNRENTIICGRTVNCKQAYELLWSKNEWYNNCRKINVWYKDEQYVYVPIKKIEKEYVDNIKVYNLNVPKTNTYCVPFIVHNCSEGGSRGAHVTELIIDEAASADKVGKTDIILSAKAQVSTSPDIRILETCYDEQTEVLTIDGWKYFKDLTYNDKIATLNSVTFELEYQNPTNIVNYNHNGKMYYLDTSQVNLMVTPKHKMFVKKLNSEYSLIEAEKIASKCHYKYKKDAKWIGEENEYFIFPTIKSDKRNNIIEKVKMDDWLCFFGFWLAEGWTTGTKHKVIGVRQKNKKILYDLQKRLLNNGIKSSFHGNDILEIYNTQIWSYLKQFGHAENKFIPKEIKKLSSRQLKILLAYYLMGDGSLHKRTNHISATTVSSKLKDDLQELALKTGYSANFYINENTTPKFIEGREIFQRHTAYNISFIKKYNEPFVHQTKNFDKYVDYIGKTYCVEVPNHIIYVRRNGKSVWSGNSTAQTISGDFYDTWRNAEAKGYKRYTWSLAKHISGNKNIYEVYKDRNPKNWRSNVPWVKDQNIEYFRREYNDDKFLVEILGGIGKSSGLVFAPEDIEACVCKRCIEEKIGDCKPYEEGYCPLIQYYMNLTGEKNIPKSNEDALRAIQTRVEGIDWGRNAPSTYVAVGKYKSIIFVLDAQEVVGVSDSAKIQKAINVAKEWKINVLRPDPREWAYNNTLRNKGFTVHELWTDKGGEDKYVYLYTLQRFIEHHSLIIPCKFKGLINSLKNLTYTDDGKIVKKNDHYADGCLYAVSYYGDFEGESLSWVEDLEKEKLISNESNIDNEENKEKTGRIENFEEWYLKQKKKYYNPNNDSESDFPWGIGSSVW